MSNSDDEDVTLLIQPGLASRDDQVQLNLVNLLGLYDEAFTWVSEGRQEDSDHHSQVQLVATKLGESIPPVTWARIGNIFDLSGRTIFQHVREDRWTQQTAEKRGSLTSTTHKPEPTIGNNHQNDGWLSKSHVS
jgi:hypothetical protein